MTQRLNWLRMFIERLDYAMTHLGWLGFLTAVYFAGIGLWLAQLLWRRSKATVWRQRSEIFEDYKSLNQRAVENQMDLLEACEIQENSLLQRDAQLAEARQQLESIAAKILHAESLHQSDQESLAQREAEIQTLKSQLNAVLSDLDKQRFIAEKLQTQNESKLLSASQRIATLEESLQRTAKNAQAAQEQISASDRDLRELQVATVADLNAARKTIQSNAQLQVQYDKLQDQFVATEKELEATLLGEHNAKLKLQELEQRFEIARTEMEDSKVVDRSMIADLREQLDEAEAKLSEIMERPSDSDDLTEIVGVSRRIEEQLNQARVFRFDQIAAWATKDQRNFEKQLGLPGRVRDGQWVEQAADLAGFALAERTGESQPEPSKPKYTSYVRALRKYGNVSVRVDDSLGVLFTRRPAHVDDLTVVRGIGRVNERCLRKAGVYHLQQIADWNVYNIWAFNQLLSFKGRIEREDWVGQAQTITSAHDEQTIEVSITMPVDQSTQPAHATSHRAAA